MAGTARGRSHSKKSSSPICASSKATYADVEANDDVIVSGSRRFFRSDADIEEAAQEVRLHIWKKLHTFRGDANLRTWMYRVTANKCLMIIRERNARRHGAIESLDVLMAETHFDAVDQTPDPFRRTVATAQLAKVTQRRFAPLLALVIEHSVKGETFQDMADARKIPIGSMKAQISRSRAKLRAALR